MKKPAENKVYDGHAPYAFARRIYKTVLRYQNSASPLIVNAIKMESNLTLKQGLENFHNKYKDYLHHDKDDASKEAKAFFESHDVAHVLFDCDISLYGEGVVKIWTIFGTTLGFWEHIKEYQDANAFELAKDFTFLHILKNIFKFLIAIPTVILRAKQMSKPWDWVEYDQYLDSPISEIREEFNIKTLKG